MTTTTDPTALLAALEELHAFLWDEMEFFSDDTDAEHRWTTHALGQKHDDLVERFHDAYAAASPTLARVLAIGTAIEALVAVTHPLDHIVIARHRIGVGTAWDAYTMNNTDSPRRRPAEATALADALRKERGA